jgi:hypothetical protein
LSGVDRILHVAVFIDIADGDTAVCRSAATQAFCKRRSLFPLETHKNNITVKLTRIDCKSPPKKSVAQLTCRETPLET